MYFLKFKEETLSFLYLFTIVGTIPRLLTLVDSNFNDTALGFMPLINDYKILYINLASRFSSDFFCCTDFAFCTVTSKGVLEKHKKIVWWAVLSLSIIYVLYLCVVVYYKVKTIEVTTFDIGIFSQMFERMNTDWDSDYNIGERPSAFPILG